MKDLLQVCDHMQLVNSKLNQFVCDHSLTLSETSRDISKSKPVYNWWNVERRKRYLTIDDDKRRIIIFEVMIMNNSLKEVCDKYHINFSSAKNVIQIYKKEGRLEKKI